MCFYRSILKRRRTHKIKTSYSYICDNNRFDDMSLKVNNIIMISPSSRTFDRQISQPYFTSVPHTLLRIFLFFHYCLRFMPSYIEAIFVNFKPTLKKLKTSTKRNLETKISMVNKSSSYYMLLISDAAKIHFALCDIHGRQFHLQLGMRYNLLSTNCRSPLRPMLMSNPDILSTHLSLSSSVGNKRGTIFRPGEIYHPRSENAPRIEHPLAENDWFPELNKMLCISDWVSCFH